LIASFFSSSLFLLCYSLSLLFFSFYSANGCLPLLNKWKLKPDQR
jgi:hypothetical protein